MLELVSSHACHGGEQRFYKHDSKAVCLPMRFSVYLPPQALRSSAKLPALFYLAGLTCTEETFPTKAGAQRFASEHGIILVAPDTSPRGAGVAGESEAWDFGLGAGFYVDATREPWAKHYRMYSYVRDELRETVLAHFPVDGSRLGIFGHSMGGHGALVLALRNPEIYRSVSAFAPISAPTLCPWGEKAFRGYLGDNVEAWKRYDATELISNASKRFPGGILIDQGLSDQFLAEQLHPDALEAACKDSGQHLTLRRFADYDHGYYFISTFIGDHIAHHARTLCLYETEGGPVPVKVM
ncbi:S-Formylglutathione hydrolase (FghA) (plasmid) [Paraburkholderia caffeinilytica]|uniref:S-formylglutathione hydrolase n=2 Tax=Paraburkholderia TaxID=1822464 RepID=A0A6J5FPG3_9BURK|nr:MULTISPECIES: S-formylglutathione hydrolase [Paraburkholderia]ATC20481.1 S-formylglutathione hydrolase [Paraburkholderia caffeinilytica]AXL53966.1 S-Formylglutathione hydrolase (FghA) [Paraburkholderia caffeinilytica]CAB3782003.1 S-formylglutathione hydrolase FrmB [Paraburkholderia caffeinitolerans]CAB3802572.1 S-formylglutathione hydrolase FrmB [Paraburkholderia caffeinilytica]GGC64898.1 S-formylglutathione hydrolase [Paraburkholderia caffeinilytica]